MARAPTYESQVLPASPGPALPTRVDTGIAGLIEKPAEMVARLGEMAAQAQTEAEKNRAALILQRELGSLRTAIEREGNTDFVGRRARFEQGAAQLVAQLGESVGGSGRAAFRNEATRAVIGQSIEVERQAFRDLAEHTRATIDALMEEAAIQLANPATTPDQRAAWLGRIRQTTQAAAGVVNPTWLTNAEQRFRRSYATNLTIAWAQQRSPIAAYTELSSGRIGNPEVAAAYGNMTPQEQLTLRRTLLSMANEQRALAERGGAAADRASRAEADRLRSAFVTAQNTGDAEGMRRALDALAAVPGASEIYASLSDRQRQDATRQTNERIDRLRGDFVAASERQDQAGMRGALDELARTPGAAETYQALARVYAEGPPRGAPSQPLQREVFEARLAAGQLRPAEVDQAITAGTLSPQDGAEFLRRIGAQAPEALANAIAFARTAVGEPRNFAFMAVPSERQAAASSAAQRIEAQLRDAYAQDRTIDLHAEARRLVQAERERFTRLQAISREIATLPPGYRGAADLGQMQRRLAEGGRAARGVDAAAVERLRALLAEKATLEGEP
ncbi:hypothetical protein J4558_00055 [Leptolyngbya sp. 15MV]|nr:hypothetical protein J4558_00055 [Leptolyngbya sp. 15MV]